MTFSTLEVFNSRNTCTMEHRATDQLAVVKEAQALSAKSPWPVVIRIGRFFRKYEHGQKTAWNF